MESFGGADFGDARRSLRFVRMMARSAAQPSGRITQVFVDGAERQAAYDFVENEAISSSAVIDAIGLGCARRAAHEAMVLIAVDGTSLNLTDSQGLKGFGSVGTRQKNARGLKVMNTLALRVVRARGLLMSAWAVYSSSETSSGLFSASVTWSVSISALRSTSQSSRLAQAFAIASSLVRA